jgi:hypothetical protein
MSVFRNITGSNNQVYVQGFLRLANGAIGQGAIKFLDSNDTFEGSNYFKRFTRDGMIEAGVDELVANEEALLEVVTDDGTAFDENAVNVPNNPRVFNEVIPVGDDVLIDFEDELGGPALFTTISVSGEDIYVYLNDSSDARVTVEDGTSLSFSAGELLLNSVRLSNTISGASSTATVQIISANIV